MCFGKGANGFIGEATWVILDPNFAKGAKESGMGSKVMLAVVGMVVTRERG